MEHCSRSHGVFYRALPLCLLVESAPTRRVGRVGLSAARKLSSFCSSERARLAACKTLAIAKTRVCPSTTLYTARTSAVTHAAEIRSSGLNDASIDRFLLGLDGCSLPVSSTSGTQHCALRHAHATCVETNLGRCTPSTRRPGNCTCSMAWRFYAIDATLPSQLLQLDGVEVHEGLRNNITHWLISTQAATS